MVTLFLFAALAAQASPPADRPFVQTCPDGSVIFASDNCVIMPDHRYAYTHQAETEARAAEWWCRGDRHPSMARIRLRLLQNRDASRQLIPPTTSVDLVALRVKGRAPQADTLRRVRQSLASLNNVDLGGRCLFRGSGGIQSVLTIRGYERGRRDPRNIEIKLD